MSQEARTIRPFVGIESVADLFDESSVYFGMDQCPAGSSISLLIDPDEYARRPVVMQWTADESFEEFRSRLQAIPGEIGMPEDALSLMLMASTSYLKRVERIFLVSMNDVDALEPRQSLTGDSRPGPFMAGHHGSYVDAYLLINRDIEPKPLSPWRKGTWLAHTRFGLLTSIGKAMFRPTPLTKEGREELGLDGRTMRYFDLGDHALLEPYDDQPEEPRFYVDDQLLAELSANAHSPASKSLQLQLVLDFMTAVINEAARSTEQLDAISYADIEESLLGRVLRVAAGPGARPTDRESLFSKVRSDPGKAIARAEHTVDLQKAVIGVFHEEVP